MAVNPQTLILNTDQFLLNRGGATFKTPFENLAENVLNLVLDGDNGGENSLIILNDLFDVSTEDYIKFRDSAGQPAVIGNKNLDRADAFWLLQYVDSRVSREDGEAQKPGFVLADASDFLNSGGASDVKELNDLTDVTTKIDTAYLPATAGDSFLLCVSTPGPTGAGLYQPRSLSSTINNIIDLGPNAPGDGIQIEIENLVDVNPIFIGTGGQNPDGSDEIEAARLRLEVTDDYKNGIPNAVKYNAILAPKEFDDILVYLTGTTADDVLVDDLINSGLVDENGDEIDFTNTPLPFGWYYAENISDGTGKLEPADVNDATEIVAALDDQGNPNLAGDSTPILPGGTEEPTHVKLGGVIVLPNRDATLAQDNVRGDYYLQSEGKVPSNIGITPEGVLYSNIPNTLSFVSVIDIVGSDPTTGTNPTSSIINNKYLLGGRVEFGPGVPVQPEGPGDSITKEDWNNDQSLGDISLPTTGDFYVVRFIDEYDEPNNPDGVNYQQAKGAAKVLKWNDYFDTDPSTNDSGAIDADGNPVAGTPGPDLLVFNGDIVVFGENSWSIMGTVNTDVVAQDLQSVTDRGFTTTNPIKLMGRTGELNNGLIVGQPVNFTAPGAISVLADGGVTATEQLITNNINFDYIKDLADA